MSARSLADSVLASVQHVHVESRPFRHLLFENVFDKQTSGKLAELPFEVPDIDVTDGRRAANNDARSFFDSVNRRRFPVCEDVAATLQSPEVVAHVAECFQADLKGSYLRIEYALDTDGFWLEPHKDISAKRISWLIYLSREPDAQKWGTDIYVDADTWHGTVPGGFNSALGFSRGGESWHGFRKRPIQGVRRSLIVNYVEPDWRSRHELAFPEVPVS